MTGKSSRKLGKEERDLTHHINYSIILLDESRAVIWLSHTDREESGRNASRIYALTNVVFAPISTNLPPSVSHKTNTTQSLLRSGQHIL